MLRWLVIGLISYFAVKLIGRALQQRLQSWGVGPAAATSRRQRAAHRDSGPPALVEDPVCKVLLPKEDAVACEVKGEMIYFCSDRCLKDWSLANQR